MGECQSMEEEKQSTGKEDRKSSGGPQRRKERKQYTGPVIKCNLEGMQDNKRRINRKDRQKITKSRRVEEIKTNEKRRSSRRKGEYGRQKGNRQQARREKEIRV
jgi:hypothetical protein